MKTSLQTLKKSFAAALRENTLLEVAPVLREMVIDLKLAASHEVEAAIVAHPTIEGRTVTIKEVPIPEGSLPVRREKKPRKPRKMTAAQLKNLKEAREAYFKKMGFGKYSKKEKKSKKKNGKAA
jgi:hypothetical protein